MEDIDFSKHTINTKEFEVSLNGGGGGRFSSMGPWFSVKLTERATGRKAQADGGELFESGYSGRNGEAFYSGSRSCIPKTLLILHETFYLAQDTKEHSLVSWGVKRQDEVCNSCRFRLIRALGPAGVCRLLRIQDAVAMLPYEETKP